MTQNHTCSAAHWRECCKSWKIASRIVGLVLFGPESKPNPGNQHLDLEVFYSSCFRICIRDRSATRATNPLTFATGQRFENLHPCFMSSSSKKRNNKNAVFLAAKVLRMYAFSEKTGSLETLECYLLEKGCTGGTRQSWRRERRFPQKDRLEKEPFSRLAMLKQKSEIENIPLFSTKWLLAGGWTTHLKIFVRLEILPKLSDWKSSQTGVKINNIWNHLVVV